MERAVIPVFVYGTLKPGEINDWVYRDYPVRVQPRSPRGFSTICPWDIRPSRIHSRAAGFDGTALRGVWRSRSALSGDRDRVHGFLLTFGHAQDNLPILDVPILDVPMIDILDQFEQHDPVALRHWVPEGRLEAYGYQRQLVAVADTQGAHWGLAWAYTMSLVRVLSLGGIRISHGLWRSDDEYMDSWGENPDPG